MLKTEALQLVLPVDARDDFYIVLLHRFDILVKIPWPFLGHDLFMDLLYFRSDILHPVQFFLLNFPYRGQVHLFGHPFRHLLAPLADEAVVIGLPLKVYPVGIQVDVHVLFVPMDKGNGLVLLEVHFLEEPFGHFLESFAFQFPAVLDGGAQHKAERVLPAEFILFLDDLELLGDLPRGLPGQILAVDNLRSLLLVHPVAHGGRCVRYGFAHAYHFLKFKKCCRISLANWAVSSANLGLRLRNMLVISLKFRWYLTNSL